MKKVVLSAFENWASKFKRIYATKQQYKIIIKFAIIFENTFSTDVESRKVVFELLKHKAQDCINFEDNQGQVPLHVAVQFAPLGRNDLMTFSKYNICIKRVH